MCGSIFLRLTIATKYGNLSYNKPLKKSRETKKGPIHCGDYEALALRNFCRYPLSFSG